MFTERREYLLPSTITVDITEPGTYDNRNKPNKPRYLKSTSGTISAGTRVDCYYAHYDPSSGTGEKWIDLENGVFYAPAEILGMMVCGDTLDNSDWLLGSSETIYPYGHPARGFEHKEERITLAEDMRTIIFDKLSTAGAVEEIRIITRPAPGDGAFPSYARNGMASTTIPRPGQILLIEYKKTVVYFDDQQKPLESFDYFIALRHFGKANVALVDGSVKLMEPDKINFHNSEIREKHWEP